MTAQILMDERE